MADTPRKGFYSRFSKEELRKAYDQMSIFSDVIASVFAIKRRRNTSFAPSSRKTTWTSSKSRLRTVSKTHSVILCALTYWQPIPRATSTTSKFRTRRTTICSREPISTELRSKCVTSRSANRIQKFPASTSFSSSKTADIAIINSSITISSKIMQIVIWA